MSSLAEQMEKIVGASFVSNEGGVVRVSPATTEEVSAVVMAANEIGAVVMPVGGGSKLGWGNEVNASVILSLARMNSILEHTWQDLTVRVQAGCSWAAMQAALAKHGQMVALDPLWARTATVGGVTAVNDSGALRLRYGALRDLVIGMTMVLADGTIARSGGKVVKNVAGYDMHKLMTGAYGTLGVITEVNFRLHPMELDAAVWSVTGDTAALGAVLLKVMDSQMQVTAMQMVQMGHGRFYGKTKEESRLDVRFAGHRDCLVSQEQQLRALLSDGLVMDAAADDVWLTREKIFDRAELRDALVVKVAMLPSQIAAVTSTLARGECEVQCVTQARGLMTAAIYGNAEDAGKLVMQLRGELRMRGGSVVALRVPRIMRGLDVWGGIGSALPLMLKVKAELDAKNTLNRGRMI